MTNNQSTVVLENKSELRFGFGKNWQDFLESRFDAHRLAAAARSLQELLGVADLVGKTFLDIGCGSGLFSLAACMLGAERVFSFDYDHNSVKAAQDLRRRAAIDPQRWEIVQGSVLDEDFMASIQPADVVYSWGVLHHTGSMWRAIDLAISKVPPAGMLAIAIYNRVDKVLTGSRMAWRVKKVYNQSPVSFQYFLEYTYVGLALVQAIIRGQSPMSFINSSARGMDFWIDVRDWMGGFPYEYASIDEITQYVERRGLQTVLVTPMHGLGCNEFAFRRL